MNFRKHLFILRTIESLKENGSWTGKTHVQKSLFLLEASSRVEVPFQFVLYRHGPYSFEIEEELELMRSYGAIALEPILGYGVMLQRGQMADFVKREASLRPEEECAIREVCQFVGRKVVAELEKVATAAWIRSREGLTVPDSIAHRLHFLKPHISIDEARLADRQLVDLPGAGFAIQSEN